MSEALEIAKKVYNHLHSKGYGNQHPILILVDFTKPVTTRRLQIINVDTGNLITELYVANGLKYPSFSNVPGSKQSSLGAYLTGETYTGKHGLSRRIDGLDKGYNDNARARSVVIHGANYVGAGKRGNSWGCFAVPYKDIDLLLNYTPPKTILVAYYPSALWQKYLDKEEN